MLAISVIKNQIDSIDEAGHSFTLVDGFSNIEPGRYSLLKGAETIQLRVGTPLGQYLLDQADIFSLMPTSCVFDLSGYPYHSATLEQFKGESGYCIGYNEVASNSHDKEELFICCVSDNGKRRSIPLQSQLAIVHTLQGHP